VKGFARAAFAGYATNLAAALLSLVNVLIVARALGPEGRGDIAFLITIALLCSNLASFGVQEANANMGGSQPLLRRVLAGNSVVFAAVFGTLAAAAVGLIAIDLLLGYLRRHDYTIFVIYRLVLAAAIVVVIASGWRGAHF
jgi:O-antigen/teichoic acid export membrane protein